MSTGCGRGRLDVGRLCGVELPRVSVVWKFYYRLGVFAMFASGFEREMTSGLMR